MKIVIWVIAAMLLAISPAPGQAAEGGEPVFDDDLFMIYEADEEYRYVYNEESTLAFEDFPDSGIVWLNDIKWVGGNRPLRLYEETFYTIYSLKDRELCYVILNFEPYIGSGFLLSSLVKYPSDEYEDIRELIWEPDQPEAILGIE